MPREQTEIMVNCPDCGQRIGVTPDPKMISTVGRVFVVCENCGANNFVDLPEEDNDG
jgi:transcription elongation factor Elf1